MGLKRLIQFLPCAMATDYRNGRQKKIITDSSDAFGLAFTTFRLGNVMHHSETGHSNPLDFQSMFIRGCSKVGAAPVIPEWRMEGTPVDVAARTVVHVSGTSQKWEYNLSLGPAYTSTLVESGVFHG